MYLVLSVGHRLAAARSRAAYRLLGNAVPDALLSVPASHLCLYGEDRRQPPRVLARDRAQRLSADVQRAQPAQVAVVRVRDVRPIGAVDNLPRAALDVLAHDRDARRRLRSD